FALVGDFSRYRSDGLQAFIRESNRGGRIRFADTVDAALEALADPCRRPRLGGRCILYSSPRRRGGGAQRIPDYNAAKRRRKADSRTLSAHSSAASRNVRNRLKPRARASAKASSSPRASSSSHKPRMINVFLVRSSRLSNRATS